MRRLFSTLIALTICIGLSAQRHVTVSGYILDADSGEPLIAAAVISETSGVVSNSFGYYSINVPVGVNSFEYSYIGYDSRVLTFNAVKDTLVTVRLNPASEMLESAVVTTSRSETGVRGTQMSAIEVPVNLIKAVPALGGEVDIIKALQLMPGVQGGTEGSAGMYVRGGGPDENLMLLDGVPLYNVNHMFGFFSVFNADAVSNVTLYKGSFPAHYGSRLSSVVDVRMKEGNEKEFHGAINIGALSSRVNFEGPIIKGKTTFNISGRRTYSDILMQPLLMLGYVDGEKVGAGYYFYDFNAKITHRFSDRDKLFLSFYSGDDRIYVKLKSKYSNSSAQYSETLNLNWNWGNLVSSLRWNHVFTPKFFMNATVNYTRYRHALGIGMDSWQKVAGEGESKMNIGMDYDSRVGDISNTMDFEYKPVPGHDIKFGSQYTYHQFQPAVSSIQYSVSMGGYSEKTDSTFQDAITKSHELALYFEDNWDVTDYLKTNIGGRYNMYALGEKTYHSFDPRVSARLLITEDLSAKASYSRMHQFVHLLSNSNLSLPTDLWVPVTKNIAPMVSDQVAGGLFYALEGYDLSLEGYYKTMENVMEYKDGASFLGSSTGWEEKVVLGRGWSYGVEALIQKNYGNLTGWIGYTWSHSWRLFDKEGAMLNNGNRFPAKYDREHDLNMTLSYKINKKWDVSATFIYSTGNAGSLATRNVAAPSDPAYGQSWNISSTEYLESRNNYRMPDYKRVDIGVNRTKQLRRGRTVFNLSVYNALNTLNPFLVYQGYKDNGDRTMKMVSIFPILPSISYGYEF